MAINNNNKKTVGAAAAVAGVAAGAGIGVAGAAIVGAQPNDEELIDIEDEEIVVATPAEEPIPAPHVHAAPHVAPADPEVIVEGVDDNGIADSGADVVQDPEFDNPGDASHEVGTPAYIDVPEETTTPASGAPAMHTENPDPQVEVLGYDTVTNDDGSTMDIATVSVDGQAIYYADVDMDTYAEFAFSDLNGDGSLSDDEIADVSEAHISMEPFAAAAPTAAVTEQVVVEESAYPDPVVSDPAISSPATYDDGGDYINDANVDDYID